MISTTTKESPRNLTAEDIRSAASTAKRDVQKTAENVVEDISNYASKAGQKVRSFIDTASVEVNHASEVVTQEIRTNPVRSSAIALGVGFILASLLRR